MNNNNDNECLFLFFSRYYFPSFLLDRSSRACSGAEQSSAEHQDREIYMWAEAKKILLGTRSLSKKERKEEKKKKVL